MLEDNHDSPKTAGQRGALPGAKVSDLDYRRQVLSLVSNR